METNQGSERCYYCLNEAVLRGGFVLLEPQNRERVYLQHAPGWDIAGQERYRRSIAFTKPVLGT